MTNAIKKFLQIPATAAAIKTAIDDTIQEYRERNSILNTYCPLVDLSQLTPDEQLESHVKSQKAGIAHHWDRQIQNMAAIKLESLMWRSLNLDPDQDSTLTRIVVGYIMSLVRSHISLLDFLAWQELQKNSLGLCDLDWSSTRNTDALSDLARYHTEYQKTTGYPADAIAISRFSLPKLSLLVAGIECGDPDLSTSSAPSPLSIVLASKNLPPFVFVDDFADITASDGTGMATRLLDKDTIVFLSRHSGFKRVLGGTLEANGAGGVFIRTYTDSDGTEVTDTISRPSVLSSRPSFAFKVKT